VRAGVPIGELDSRYSSPGAEPESWTDIVDVLEHAEVFWFTTVRHDGRPHTTPLLAIWMDGAMYISTGEGEQKARNVRANPHCSLTTGCNALMSGFDVVVEGRASLEQDEVVLQRLVNRYQAKYQWTFTVQNGAIVGDQDNVAIVFRIDPAVVYGFGKGDPFTHVRWTFD
jgi:general stress protein 26